MERALNKQGVRREFTNSNFDVPRYTAEVRCEKYWAFAKSVGGQVFSILELAIVLAEFGLGGDSGAVRAFGHRRRADRGARPGR